MLIKNQSVVYYSLISVCFLVKFSKFQKFGKSNNQAFKIFDGNILVLQLFLWIAIVDGK